MKLKIASLIGLGMAILGLVYLLNENYIFSKNPIAIVIQICAFALMIWARLTFGLRSFHATANTTRGGLVTKGPYRLLRHPIYAAIIYFVSASLISFPFIQTLGAIALIVIGLFIRIVLEEKSLLASYPEYVTYCKRAKRIIPFLF